MRNRFARQSIIFTKQNDSSRDYERDEKSICAHVYLIAFDEIRPSRIRCVIEWLFSHDEINVSANLRRLEMLRPLSVAIDTERSDVALIVLYDQQAVNKSSPGTVGGHVRNGGICFASDARIVVGSFMRARFLEHPRSSLTSLAIRRPALFSFIPVASYAHRSFLMCVSHQRRPVLRASTRGAQVVDRRSSLISRAS